MKYKLTKTLGLLMTSVFVSTTVLTGAIYAENSNTEEQAKDKEENSDAIEVLVTARGLEEQDTKDVPFSVSTVTSETIENRAPVDVDDAIRNLPGVGMAPAEGNPNYWQEGFTIRGLGAQRVLTLTDGVRQAGQGIGYGGGNLSLYDPLSIETIEVLRGPGSVLYGTDAFGGVVNIITKNPTQRDEWGIDSKVRYGFDAARDMHTGGASFDFGNDKYAAVFGGSYTDAAEPNLPDDQDPQSGSFERESFWGKVDYFIDNKSKIRLSGNYTNNRDVLVTDSAIPLPIAKFPPPGASDLIVSPLFFEFPKYSRLSTGLEYITEDLSPTWKSFQTGLYYTNLRREFHRETAYYTNGSPGFAGPPTFIDPTSTIATAVVDTDDTVDTIEWQTVSKHKYDDHALTVGLDIGHDQTDLPEVETITTVAVAGIGRVPPVSNTTSRNRADAEQTRVGLFGQDEWDINNFKLITGVRADGFFIDDSLSDFSDEEFGASGNIGLVYRPEEDWSTYVNLASGFRVPDLGERFQTGIVNLGAPTAIIGKEDLDPERAYSAEIGAKAKLNSFKFETAAYVNRINDYIGLTPLGFVNGYATDQYDNVGDITLYGGELAVGWDVSKQLELFSNVSRTWTNDDDKIDVMNWVFNYGISHSLEVNSSAMRNLTSSLNFRSVLESEDNTPSAGREPYDAASFTVVDLILKAELNSGKKGSTYLLAGVRNLLDKSYQEPFFALDQPERSVFATLQFGF
jgi:hemoglobin/transferrin/lactoferrin receptor protein